MKTFFEKTDHDEFENMWVSKFIIYDLAEISKLENKLKELFPTCETGVEYLKYGSHFMVSFKNESDEAHFVLLQNSGVFR